MATLGSSPSFDYYFFDDTGSPPTIPSQVVVGLYTMPQAGWIVQAVIYLHSDAPAGSPLKVQSVLWDSTPVVRTPAPWLPHSQQLVCLEPISSTTRSPLRAQRATPRVQLDPQLRPSMELSVTADRMLLAIPTTPSTTS